MSYIGRDSPKMHAGTISNHYILKKRYNSDIIQYYVKFFKIRKRRYNNMNNLIKEGIFIKETEYQKMKKRMHKKSDYFTIEEITVCCKINSIKKLKSG